MQREVRQQRLQARRGDRQWRTAKLQSEPAEQAHPRDRARSQLVRRILRGFSGRHESKVHLLAGPWKMINRKLCSRQREEGGALVARQAKTIGELHGELARRATQPLLGVFGALARRSDLPPA